MVLGRGHDRCQAAPRFDPPTESPMHKIVDTHHHLWDLDVVRPAWFADAPEVLKRSYTMADFKQATQGLPIEHTVYMEVDVLPEDQLAEAEYVLLLCPKDDNPMSACVLSAHPLREDFVEKLALYRKSPYFRGLRQVLHEERTPPGMCLQKEFVTNVQRLGAKNEIFDLCVRRDEIPDATKLVEACPDVRFVLDHLGNPLVQADSHDAWRRDIEALAKLPNVVCKISGIVASARPQQWRAEELAPLINHCWDAFGPDRVMFGGDWPVCRVAAEYRQWVEALNEIARGRSQEDQRKLWSENAMAFYKLVPRDDS